MDRAAGDHVELHVSGRSHLLRETMAALDKGSTRKVSSYPSFPHREHGQHCGAVIDREPGICG